MRENRIDTPLISVVIPVYNREDLVVDAVRSCLGQTYGNIEVLVVDDASTDGSYEVCRRFGPPVFVFRQDHKGQSAARNLGIECASGQYVLFLDSDDVLEPEALEVLWNRLAAHERKGGEWGASYGIKRSCDERLREVKSRPKHYHEGWLLPHILFDNFVRTGTFLVRKSILTDIGKFREDLVAKEDLLLVYSIAANHKFCFVGRPVAKHRRHGGPRARDSYVAIVKQGTKHLDYFFEAHGLAAGLTETVRRKVYGAEHLELSKIAWRSGMTDKVWEHWMAALKYTPRRACRPKSLLRDLVSKVRMLHGA